MNPSELEELKFIDWSLIGLLVVMYIGVAVGVVLIVGAIWGLRN